MFAGGVRVAYPNKSEQRSAEIHSALSSYVQRANNNGAGGVGGVHLHNIKSRPSAPLLRGKSVKSAGNTGITIISPPVVTAVY